MSRTGKILSIVLLLIASVILVRNAWVCDDAYISFRTVDNAVNGYGLRWNVAERVQAYTHPLWVLLLIPVYALSGEIYYTSILLSAVVSLIAIAWVMYKVTPDIAAGASAAGLLILSKPWIDFSVSGLENPLSHLTIVLFLWIVLRDNHDRRSLLSLGCSLALAAMTRLDLLLLLGPAVVGACMGRGRWQKIGWLFVGAMPLWLWELFSLWYYGSLIPNTAYAKLSTGIAADRLFEQGYHYLVNGTTQSTLTAVVIVLGVLGLIWHWKSGTYRWLVVGMILHLLYICKVGGDFMSGRFLTPVFTVAVVLLFAKPMRLPRWMAASGVMALFAVGLTAGTSPLWSGNDYGTHAEEIYWDSCINDERAGYYQTTGLLVNFGQENPPLHPWAAEGRSLRQSDSLVFERPGTGFIGFFAGPKLYIVDRQGLSDPLIGKLPIPTPTKWRIGHFNRVIPEGYIESVRNSDNRIEDVNLARYYDAIRTVARGDLFSWERLKSIISLNTGQYDKYLAAYWRRPLHNVEYEEINKRRRAGTRYNDPKCLIMTSTGITVTFDSTMHARRIEVSVDGNDRYQVTLLSGDTALQHVLLKPPRPVVSGLRLDTVTVVDSVSEVGYSGLYIRAGYGDSAYALGHVLLLD